MELLLPELKHILDNVQAGPIIDNDNLLLKLYTKVLTRDRQSKTATTLLNFETAAFHLSYLLKVLFPSLYNRANNNRPFRVTTIFRMTRMNCYELLHGELQYQMVQKSLLDGKQ